MRSFADGLREALARPSPAKVNRAELIADVLAQPHVRQALRHPVINRQDQVPLVAGASEGRDTTTHIDERVPERFPHPAGGSYSPDPFLHVHETVEKDAMDRHGLSYHDAHYGVAIPIEAATVEASGIPRSAYNAHMTGAFAHIKGKKADRSPPNLYDQPYREMGQMHLLGDRR
jgi:hypothetical protein